MISPAAATRPRQAVTLLLMLVAVVVLVLGCGGGTSPGPAGGTGSPAAAPTSAPSSNPVTSPTIVIKNFAFQPVSLTVAAGTTIKVINEDQAPHTVTAADKSFDTGTLSGGRSGEFTAPAKPGTYPYICTIHQYMMGTLIVR
jgi:plastocyanin